MLPKGAAHDREPSGNSDPGAKQRELGVSAAYHHRCPLGQPCFLCGLWRHRTDNSAGFDNDGKDRALQPTNVKHPI